MPLTKFHKQTIDLSIKHLLLEFFDLPKEAALEALKELAKIQAMGAAQNAYPALPELFKNEAFNNIAIQETLKQLSEIMFNRQPQDAPKYDSDQGNEVNFGKLALRDEHGIPISADEVHAYLKSQFELTILSIHLYHQDILPLIQTWKTTKYGVYYKYFSDWVDKYNEEISDGMKKILLPKDILIKRIKKRFDEKSDPLDQLLLDKLNAEDKKLLNYLDSLPPSVYDKDADECFEELFKLPRQLSQEPALLAVFKGLTKQISDELAPPNLIDVCSSFVLATKTHLSLKSYGNLIGLHQKELVDRTCKCVDACLRPLEALPQLPNVLSKDERDVLHQYSSAVDLCLKEERISWFSDFFAIYFSKKEAHRQEKFLKEFFFLALDLKRVQIDDRWIDEVFKANINHVEGTVDLSPYCVNRVLLHALVVPVEYWSERYYDVFKGICALLESRSYSERLKENSYPNELREQLAFLDQLYKNKQGHNKEEVSYPVNLVFPMIQYPRDSKGLGEILAILSPDQSTSVCKSLTDKRPEIIKTVENLVEVLSRLSPKQCTAVCKILTDKLPMIIKKTNDFEKVLYDLSPQQRTEVYQSLKDKLPELIKTVGDFKTVLYYLSPQQRAEVYQSLKDKLPELIKTVDDFKTVLYYLSPQQHAEVYQSLKDKLPELIKTVDDFKTVLYYLSPQQRAEVYQSLKDKLPELIKTVDDFKTVLYYLSPQQRAEVYQSLKDKLPELIKTVDDFKTVLYYLSPKQFTEVYQSLKDKLPELIKTTDVLKTVLYVLSPEQSTEVYQSLKDKVPELIKTVGDFKTVLYSLSPEQGSEVCQRLKDKLPELIKTVGDFKTVLYSLSPEQGSEVCQRLKDKLPELIKTVDDFKTVLYSLYPEQFTEVYQRLKDKLPELIKTTDDFNKVTNDIALVRNILSPQQRIGFYQSLKDKLPELIKTVDDFKNVLYRRSSAECREFCQSLKDKLPEIIKTVDDFHKVLCRLSPAECREFCQNLKDKLPELIKTADDFSYVLNELSPEQRTEVYLSLKDKLPELIKTTDDFRAVKLWLSIEVQIEIYKSCKDKLLEFIKSPYDFRVLYYSIHSTQEIDLCQSLKDKLPEIIKTEDDFSRVLNEDDCFYRPEKYLSICWNLKHLLSKIIPSHNKLQKFEKIYPSINFKNILLSAVLDEYLKPMDAQETVGVGFFSKKDDLGTTLQKLVMKVPLNIQALLEVSEENQAVKKIIQDFLSIYSPDEFVSPSASSGLS